MKSRLALACVVVLMGVLLVGGFDTARPFTSSFWA